MKAMRKFTAFLLVLLMTAGIFAAYPWTLGVSAAETDSIQLETSYINPLYSHVISEEDLVHPDHKTLLADGDDVTYLTDLDDAAAVIREGMKNRETTIVVYYYLEGFSEDVAKAKAAEIADAALVHTGVPTEGDYLMWQYGGWEANISGTLDGNKANLAYTYTYTYYTTAAQEAQVDAKVEAILDELNVEDSTDYYKVKAVYDYLCKNVEYDHVHVNNTSYKTQFTAYGALIDEICVCQGYAVAMYRLMLELDVDCRLIAGKGNGENHGWNIVQLDGVYYNADSTWDAGYTTYNWFLLSEENFVDHVRFAEYDTAQFHADYPMAASDYVGCAHSFDRGRVITDPTCLRTGSIRYTCSKCGYQYEEEIPANGHSYESVVINPTCSEEGYTQHTCSVCGHKYADNYTDPLPHTYDTVVVDPTCQEEGYTRYTCTECGHEQIGDYTDKLPHDYSTVTVAPTCSAEGYDQHICAVCGHKYTDNYTETIPHTYEETVVEPTCTEEGYTRYTCTECSHSYTGNHTEVIPHNYTINTVAPTCDTQGYDQHICVDCGHKYSDNFVQPLDHTFEDGFCTACGARNVRRLYGDTRYETSFAIADALKAELGISRFSTIIVACGTDFADALSGSYLAAVKDAPILLSSGTNDADIAAYVRQNLATGGTVYLLGGNAALPETIETALADFNVKRLFGNNRYETNLEILKEAGIEGQEILVCTGTNFADSISASAVGKPILLVGATLTDAQKAFLSTTSGRFMIIGGTAAVSAEVEADLAALGYAQRLAGDNRFETSILVAQRFFTNPESAVLTYGYSFPDGLCGGSLANAIGAPLILTISGHEAEAVIYATDEGITQGYVLGGTILISDDTVEAIFSMVEEDPGIDS